MKIIACEQGSEEWRQARCGNVTASRMAELMSKVKSGESAGRRNLRAQVVCEILTGKPQDDGFVSSHMKNGSENEKYARAAYEVRQGADVDKIGFALHETIERFGASPDGLIGKNGGLELKCVLPAVQMDNILSDKVPSEYHLQMLSGMDVCEREWWDFASFSPAMPERLQLFVKRMYRDEERIRLIRDEVIRFNAEVDAVVERLRAL